VAEDKVVQKGVLLEEFFKFLRERGLAAPKAQKLMFKAGEKFLGNRDEVDLEELLQKARSWSGESELKSYFRDFLEYSIGQRHSQGAEVNQTNPAANSVLVPSHEEVELYKQPIGRVTITEKTPATPSSFTFWLKDDENIEIEPTDFVKIVMKNGKIMIAQVTDVEARKSSDSPVTDFYSYDYGNPEAEIPTERPTIRICKAEIVYREGIKRAPPRENDPIYIATEEDIEKAYNSHIPEEYRVLAGFTFDYFGKPVPIYLDRRYVLGYEGAHINITGASGLATKTSYALFLIMSLLASCEDVAVIAFNVKERDLLNVRELPEDWNEAFQLMKKHHLDERHKEMWEKARELGIDPYNLIKGGRVSIFKPGIGEEGFYYGLEDLLRAGSFALNLFLEKEDIDDKIMALTHSVWEEYRRDYSFKSLMEDLRNKMDKKEWVTVGGMPHHTKTVNKFINRIEHATRQLEIMLTIEDTFGEPIPIDELKPGNLWIVDISSLPEKGQRIVFYLVLEEVSRKLEEVKYKGKEEFPKHVAIFVDELNKFSPSGREYYGIKSRIVEITSRGRSIGLSLIGAQQLASQVDSEVLVNSSTYVVGWTHTHELGNRIYGWIDQGIKNTIRYFDKGELLLWHVVHKVPVRVRFPIPLHHLKLGGLR